MSQESIAVLNRIIEVRRDELVQGKSGSDAAEAVPAIIDDIRSAYSEEWEGRRLEYARDFLSKTEAGIPVPVLSVCGHGTQEIRYSAYLAYFLDPSRLHGVGTCYLDNVLSLLGHGHIDTGDAIVESEKKLGCAPGEDEPVECFCDIVVTCGDHVFFIEQKINSGESANPRSQMRQLQRYDWAISNNSTFDDLVPVRVFLTPKGKESSTSPHWLGLSYDDLVEAGLETLRSGGLSDIAQNNLRRFLIDVVVGPFGKTEDNIREIRELAQTATISRDFATRLQFDRKANSSQRLMDILMEGS